MGTQGDNKPPYKRQGAQPKTKISPSEAPISGAALAKKAEMPPHLNQRDEAKLASYASASSHVPLRLKATNDEELDILSSLLQDALIPAPNFSYTPNDNQFHIKVNRFCWEDKPFQMNHQKIYTRALSTVEFNHVSRVQHLNMTPDDHSIYYNLLAILPNQKDEGAEHEGQTTSTYIDLIFSGKARLRLTVEAISVFMVDSKEVSYTVNHPDHSDDAVKAYDLTDRIQEYMSANQNQS